MKTKELIEKFNIRANKNFGQNFLQNESVLDAIVDAAKGTPYAFEIGAGLGVLSRKLCDVFEKVVTIEIDRALEKVTEFTLKDAKNHTLIYQNFLKTDIESLYNQFGKSLLTCVGNLPYNITGEIIAKLIKNHRFLDSAVIMIQKEAANKLVARPKEDGYRAISVLTQYFCDIETVCEVSPDCFIPAPHVTSRVIKLRFKKDLPIPFEKEAEFYAFIHTLFSKRRKLITASMQNEGQKQKARESLKKLGFSDKTRCEELPPDMLSQFYILMFCE